MKKKEQKETVEVKKKPLPPPTEKELAEFAKIWSDLDEISKDINSARKRRR